VLRDGLGDFDLKIVEMQRGLDSYISSAMSAVEAIGDHLLANSHSSSESPGKPRLLDSAHRAVSNIIVDMNDAMVQFNQASVTSLEQIKNEALDLIAAFRKATLRVVGDESGSSTDHKDLVDLEIDNSGWIHAGSILATTVDDASPVLNHAQCLQLMHVILANVNDGFSLINASGANDSEY